MKRRMRALPVQGGELKHSLLPPPLMVVGRTRPRLSSLGVQGRPLQENLQPQVFEEGITDPSLVRALRRCLN